MIVKEFYSGGGSPFEGDRELRLLSIPEGARIRSARVTLTPILGMNGEALVQTIDFGGETWGATRSRSPATADPGWVEVDFHARRTLHEVIGTDLSGATLQVDLGGAFAEVKNNGTFLAPTDPDDQALTLGPSPEILPGLMVSRFRLTGIEAAGGVAATHPDVTSISVLSVPTNVSLGLGSQAPFFNHPGELTEPAISDDFTKILEAFLTEAPVENGFYVVPLVLHSDAITEFDLELEIDVERRQSVLPEGLDQVAMPYDFDGLPKSEEGVLQVELPPGSRVTATEGRVIGAFEESRVVLGPTGEVAPAGDVEVSAAMAQAQLLSFDAAVPATAVDLLLAAVSRTARLRLDLVEDVDGKPGGESFLAAPVEFGLDRESAGERTWISVALPAEFQFEDREQRRYWLVLQTEDGEVQWAASSAAAEAPALQHTDDGGLSWRQTRLEDGGAAGLFRLRHLPERFEMPIELQVGSGEAAQRVSLAGLEAQGNVDLDLDLPQIADAFNTYAASTAEGCPETEHLDNGDFERWFTIGDELGEPSVIERFDVSLGGSRLAVTPDGRGALLVTPGGIADPAARPAVHFVDLVCRRMEQSLELDAFGVSQVIEVVVAPAGNRAYVGLPGAVHAVDLVGRRELGSRTFLEGQSLQSLALSPDGGRLYLGLAPFSGSGPSSIEAIDTGSLEAVTSEPAALQESPSGRPAGLAVSHDGNSLFVLEVVEETEGSSDSTALRVYSTQAFGAGAELEALSTTLSSVDDGVGVVSADGRAVTIHTDGTLRFVDVATGTVSSLSQGASVSGRLAIEPGGRRLFVAAEGGVVVVDVERRRTLETATALLAAVDLAVTPTGDSLVVALPNDLAVLPLGVPQPAEWAVTGEAHRFCSEDIGAVLFLGSFPQQEIPADVPIGISQVVPVTPECPYELTFEALTTEVDAVAELFWLGDECTALRTDTVPITQAAEPEPTIALHRARIVSPAGARQAELRFSAPAGLMALRRTSLQGTSEALENVDLAQRQDGGLPLGWELAPVGAVGFVISQGSEGVAQLINGGPEPVSLVQTVAASGAKPFELAFEGQHVAQATAEEPPAIEARWLDAAGVVTGSPTLLEIAPGSAGRLVAEGTVPEAAETARLEVKLPTGATLEVTEISLRFREPLRVPLTFVAQAPGSLRITDWKVAFEPGEVPRLSPPAEGFCSPTPPGSEPGEECEKDCFCCRCKAPTQMAETTAMVTEAGRAIESGRCVNCGAEVIRIGATTTAPVATFSPRRLPSTRPARARGEPSLARLSLSIRSAFTAASGGSLPLGEPASSGTPLTAVNGIGERRAGQLREIGIDSLARLARARPEEIASLPGIFGPMASLLIARARAILAES